MTTSEPSEVKLLPTPVANDDNKTPQAHLRMKQRMGRIDGADRTQITSLAVLARARFQQPSPSTSSPAGSPAKEPAAPASKTGLSTPRLFCGTRCDGSLASFSPGTSSSRTSPTYSGWLRPQGSLLDSLWGTVLGDLAALGFDVVWDCVPAAAVGAPHLRDRVFAVATQSVGADAERDGGQRGRADGRTDVAGSGGRTAADAGSVGRERRPGQQGKGRVPAERRETSRDARDGSPASAKGVAVDWGEYGPAIGAMGSRPRACA